jgi:hypothetical protein
MNTKELQAIIDGVAPVLDAAVRKAVESLHARIADLEKQLAAIPAPSKGEDGKDGEPGRDGTSVTLEDIRPLLDEAVKSIRAEAVQAIETAVKAIPAPKDGRDGVDGKNGIDGKDGVNGEKGADGAGIADLMIDREGGLVATFTDGRMKNLGVVMGKDGRDGKDGADGISFDSFDMEYLPDTHEVHIKAVCAGRSKELRFPAGGIRPAGYWREGNKAQAGEAWVHDGSTYIAMHATTSKPEAKSDDWIIAARRGRDGERGQKGADGSPPAPIKLKD